MPAIRDLARAVIHQQWDTPDPVFDALWNTLATLPRQAGPLSTSPDTQVHALAAAGAIAEPPAIAVFIFTQAAHDLPSDVTWSQLCAKVTEIAGVLGYKGIGTRITKAAPEELAHGTDTMPAIAYLNDAPQGRPMNKGDVKDLLGRRTAFVIFIYQPRNLRDRSIGRVYLHAQPSGDAPSSPPTEMPPLQYRLLVYLLKHRHDDQRERADFVEHCWQDRKDATKLRAQTKLLPDEIRKYDVGLSRLSKLLQARLKISAVSHGSGIWELVPWPETYCVIEEQ